MSQSFALARQKNGSQSFKPALEALPEAFFHGWCYEKLKEFYEEIFKMQNDVASNLGRGLNILKRDVSEASIARALASINRPMNERELKEFAELNEQNPLEVARFIRRLGDPLLMDYVYEFWYNSILSGVPTHLVNIISNTFIRNYS